ncbi:MAG TPA: hypothetical protein VMV79_03970, partial [Alphaproteobacteria bacterium]|nr:hypothetical protein [Alphaproteobacteria bacterium]
MTRKKHTSPAAKGHSSGKAGAVDKAGTKKKATKNAAPFTPAPQEFRTLFYTHVMAADLALFPAEDRQRIAASFWQFAHKRKAGAINLRLFNPSPMHDGWTVDHTVLEIVNDDMPFLVDSVTGALQQRGLSVHLVIHPVMQVRRDTAGEWRGVVGNGGKPAKLSGAAPSLGTVRAESLMHIEFDHVLDPAFLQEIEADIRAVLDDVRVAVTDWPKMRARAAEAMSAAEASKLQETAKEDTEEARKFLGWLSDNNYTFLGYRDINLVQENGKLTAIKIVPGSGLGILRDGEIRVFGGLRDINTQAKQIQRHVQQHQLIAVAKTNLRARVHRPVAMDAVFVRRFDPDGHIVGERLFVGLFTSQSYIQNPRTIPFLRRKIDRVLARAGLDPTSHDGKSLAHILNTYPHDELFQIGEDELFRHAMGILQLQERARVALFVRYDPFERFATCLIYVPRDRYDSALRAHIQTFLENAFDGTAEEPHVSIGDSLLARAFITIRLTADSPRPDVARLEADLRGVCRAWPDRLRDCLVAEHGEAAALALLRRYGDGFPPAYRDVATPQMAMRDIYNLERGKMLVPARLMVDLSPADESG